MPIRGFHFSQDGEDDRRLDLIAEAMGWTRSRTLQELLKAARIETRPQVRVDLELSREQFGVQGD